MFVLAVGTAASEAACLRIVNVPRGDVLNLRATPSPQGEVVLAIAPDRPGVLILKRPCGPGNVPQAQQWCRVRVIQGTRLRDGFLSARYVQVKTCP